jgi:hypothetical protein
LSFAVPLHRWTASVFLNTVQNYREKFEFAGRSIPGQDLLEDGAFGTVSVQNQEYGLGLSFVLNRFISLGASGVVSSVSLASEGRSGTPFNPRNGTNTIDSGTEFTGMAGILVKPARGVSIGGSFYAGARFDLETTFFGRFATGTSGDVIRNGDVAPISYVVPPRLGMGASWRIWDRFTLVVDANRILYSRQVNDDFLIVDFQSAAFATVSSAFFQRCATSGTWLVGVATSDTRNWCANQPPEVWAGPIGEWKTVTSVNAGATPFWGEAKSLH